MAQTTLKTTIISRNDTTANWEAKKPELQPGEIGVEILENGKAKIKIGNGVEGKSTWDQLSYVGGDEAKVFQVNSLEAVPADAELVVGDIAIVKAAINPDETDIEKIKYSYTSYVFNGLDAEGKRIWAAMDGNYDATNVYFSDDITLAGSYTQVGNITKSSNSATGTLFASGKSLAEVMQSIFTQELYPATGTSRDLPELTISVSGGVGEVGTTYTLPTATVKVKDVGSYTYGPATGIKFEAGKVTLAEGSSVSGATNKKTNESDMIKDSTFTLTAVDSTAGTYADSNKTISFSASGEHTQGAMPVTNLGNDYEASRIASATVTASGSATFKGWRGIYGGGTTAETVDSAAIRDLVRVQATLNTSNGTAYSAPTTSGGNGIKFNATKGSTKVIFAYPASWTTKTPKFEIFTMAWGATEGFEKSTVQVADASGTNGLKEYNVYTYTPATPLAADNTEYCVYFA